MPIRYGFPTVDPVTRALAPVVGARLDALKKTVVPVTASSWLALSDQTDSVQVGNVLKDTFAVMLKMQETFNVKKVVQFCDSFDSFRILLN